MKQICTGLLAHVDAGKTTLSEALLYESGMIRREGRVDNGDAFLDNYELERERGITIFSKQAVLKLPECTVTLLDTPGHVDFSAEMERTLQVLDYAILLISGADGVQGHTRTLWRLLERYGVPVFLFVNKMDQPGTDRAALLAQLQAELDDACVDFSETDTETYYEAVALSSEELLDEYLATGSIAEEAVIRLIRERGIFPCYFGSALKHQGVREFLDGFLAYTARPDYPDVFGAKVFKIARDPQGTRLTYLKITGGSLKVRQSINGEEKISQIRVYSGERYETVDEAPAGSVCAVTGLTRTYPGEGLGAEPASELPVLAPVLTCRLILPEGVNPAVFLPKFRQLEEEEPELHVVWNEAEQEIGVWLMGEVQTEILKRLIAERCGVDVEFGDGRIVYKETIANAVEGVGHFEPLRHYAEVHLLLEPGEPGSGITLLSDCSEDVLDRNWQRLVLTHLAEKEHAGVLTGAPVTDICITLLTGRAHIKHTEGGDFRQATYRAVRQGLMRAQSVLLEPYYDYVLEIPEQTVGRAMTDIERMHGTISYDDAAMYGSASGNVSGPETEDAGGAWAADRAGGGSDQAGGRAPATGSGIGTAAAMDTGDGNASGRAGGRASAVRLGGGTAVTMDAGGGNVSGRNAGKSSAMGSGGRPVAAVGSGAKAASAVGSGGRPVAAVGSGAGAASSAGGVRGMKTAALRPGMRRLTGIVPAATMQNYQSEVTAYTKGEGHLFTSLHGYLPCHNTEEVIAESGYDAEHDTENPSSSVFCAHGAGFVVPWDMVPEYMHLPAWEGSETNRAGESYEPERVLPPPVKRDAEEEIWIGTEEVDRILAQTYDANKRRAGEKRSYKLSGRGRRGGREGAASGTYSDGRGGTASGTYGGRRDGAAPGIYGGRRDGAASGIYGGRRDGAASGIYGVRDAGTNAAVRRQYDQRDERRAVPAARREEYLLVDGYNIIFAWEELRELAQENIDGARGKLLDILCNYQGIRRCELIVVFDAYRVAGHQTEFFDYHNIHVVYTKEAETADQYIERFAHENGRRYQVTVATSDGLEQIIIRGAGCVLMSARELEQEVAGRSRQLLADYEERRVSGKRYLLDGVPEEIQNAWKRSDTEE